MSHRYLTALPVYNEVNHVEGVLAEVRGFSPEVLVVNDGSTDGTGDVLARISGIHCLSHPRNLGYGAALRTAFEFAIQHDYEILVTIDCDGQHEPRRIPRFVASCAGWDIVSGSRYLKQYAGDSAPPPERRHINELLTDELNRRLRLNITDAFCGFKAYRVDALKKLHITETGYAMPLEVWVQAAHAGLRIRELPVPLIYLDEKRSFGGSLDNAEIRLRHYREVLDRAQAAVGDTLQTCRGECAG
ncbi:MAG TPA: glycosyltransferase family 2 protein [Pirellulales bacterium]|jgi:dolichol-phosphate mannosyltransferase|nr:glycosyltransferase family 2 protein [Pirellulales bacterium]